MKPRPHVEGTVVDSTATQDDEKAPGRTEQGPRARAAPPAASPPNAAPRRYSGRCGRSSQ